MAAESATAEKLDLDLVSRKAAQKTGPETSPSPSPAKTTVPQDDVEVKMKRLQDTINQIRSTSQSLNEIKTPAAAANQSSAFVRTGVPNSAAKPAAQTPPAGATIRPKTVQSPPAPSAPQQKSPINFAASHMAANGARPRPMPRPRPANAPQGQQRPPQQKPSNTATTMPVPISDVQRWRNYRSPKLSMPAWQKYLPDIGMTATAAWMTGAVLYLGGIVGWDNVASMPAHHLGSVIAGVAAPIALMWMGIHYARRDRDIKEQMAPLLHQIDQLVNPNKQIEDRIDAVADALRRQANELINAANQVEKTLGNVREGLRSDMEKMMEYAGLTGKHLEQASAQMSNRTSHLARLTEQMHGRLASFEEHAKTGSDRLDQSVTDMVTKAQSATDKLERQSNNIIAALHAANMRMTRTADDLDSRIGQVANFADQTAARFGDVAAEFGRQGAVVDSATNTMEVQMLRMHDMLSQQMSEMGQSVGAFAGIGRELSGAVTNFRGLAEQIVGAAVTQIDGYTEMMDQRLSQASAVLDRTASVAMTRVGTLDADISEQLRVMQNSLREAAAETPRMVQAILDETTRRLNEMDMSFAQSGGQVTSQLYDLEHHIGTRLEAMSGLANNMTNGASAVIKDSIMTVFDQLEELKDQFVERAGGTQRDLKTFHNDLAQTIEALALVARRSTDRTVERILTLNAGISQRIMDLRDTAETAAAQGRTLEGTLAQHIGMVREANDAMGLQANRMQDNASQMLMSGAMITNDLRDATGQAMAQAEVLSHIIGREADALREVSAQSVDQMDEASARLEVSRGDLYAAIGETAGQVAQVVCDLDQMRGALEQSQSSSAETHAALYNEILRLRDATAIMNNQVNDTLLSTDNRAQELRALATRLNDVTGTMESSMRSSEMSLSNSASLVEQVGIEARDMMVRSGQEMVEASTIMSRELRDAANLAMAQAEVLSHVITREADSLHQASVVSAQTLDGATAAMEASRAELYASVMTSAEQIAQVVQRLDTQRDQIEKTTGESTHSYNTLYRETNEVCDAIASLNAQVDNTVIATDDRAQELRSLIARLDQVTGNMQSSMETSERLLSQSAGTIAEVSTKARDMMINSGQQMVETTANVASDMRETMTRSGQEIAEKSAYISSELRSLMAQSNAEITKTSQAVTAEMRDTLTRSGQEMNQMAMAMAHELRDAANQAMAQAEVLSHVITREADSLQQASSASSETLDKATAAIETSRSALYASVTASAEQILRAVQSMEAQRNQMDRTTVETTDSYGALFRETAELCQAIASLNAQVGDTMIVTDSRAEELRALTTRLGEVTMGMKAVLQSGQYNLMDSAELITKVSADARDIMMVSGSEIAEVTQQIAQNTSNITTAFQQQQDALQQSVTTGTDAIDGMVKKLEDTANNLSVASETSARDLDWLCGHIQSAGLAIGEMGVRAEDAMRNARESLVLSEASLQRTASSARINLSELSERYGNEGSRLGATHDSIEKTYGTAITRLETLGQELAGQSFHTFDSLNEMGILFDAKIAQLRDGGMGVTSQLQDVAQQLQENYASLTLCAEKAAEQMVEIKSSLTGAQSDVSLTTEHANQQVDNVRRKLGVYAQDLMMMVSQASGQIEAASAGFNDRATAMTAVANENATQLGDMGARVRLEIEQLAKTVKAVTADQAGSLSTAVERLRAQAEELARQSQQSMVELERQGIRTTDNMRQINQGAEEATLKLRETSQQLMRQSEGIAIAGTDVAKRISQATQQMQMQTQAIKTTTDKAVAVMNESGEELTGQVGQWQTAAQKVQGQMRQMLDNMSEQMAAMETSSSKAEESAKRVTQADTRLKRDAFLNSAKFIIESLNSLSIDLTRVLDPQEADRVWKEFAKGDASAFTRRFLQMREEMPLQRLKEKYERDGEFRTYAMRYFRQFEELFEQALKNDHNDLLATTLTTSDVGKLYSYLAGALGHTQLKSVGSEKAA